MHNLSTETIADHDLEALADLMADNPEFATKLAAAIAKKLNEEHGFDLGWLRSDIDDLKDGQKSIKATLGRHGDLLDTMHHNIQDLRERHDLHDGEFRKVNYRLDKIDGHLGINTDPRKRDLSPAN